MKLILIISGLLFLSGCSTLNDYELGCRDGLEVTQMIDGLSVADLSYQRKVDYCDLIENNRFHPKDESDKRAGRP